jgi:Ca2+-binding EF-hand superfamily protein
MSSKLSADQVKKILAVNPNLTNERIDEFYDTFNLFDTNRNGTIDGHELQQVMNRAGNQHFDIDAVMKMIKTVDKNGQ